MKQKGTSKGGEAQERECDQMSWAEVIIWIEVNSLMFKLVLEKAEEPEIKFPTSAGSWKSKRVPEKHLLLLY